MREDGSGLPRARLEGDTLQVKAGMGTALVIVLGLAVAIFVAGFLVGASF